MSIPDGDHSTSSSTETTRPGIGVPNSAPAALGSGLEDQQVCHVISPILITAHLSSAAAVGSAFVLSC